MLNGKVKIVTGILIALMLSLTLTLAFQAALGYRDLNRGDWGYDVRQLQYKLRQAGYNINVDGIFGRKTENAVRAFQRAHSLRVDGIVGRSTIAALKKVAELVTNRGGRAVDGISNDLKLFPTR